MHHQPEGRAVSRIDPHQIRRNRISELSITVVAVNVSSVFMGASLCSLRCFGLYNNFRTMHGGWSPMSEYCFNSHGFEDLISPWDPRAVFREKGSQSIQR
jgi:hypothetical protein